MAKKEKSELEFHNVVERRSGNLTFYEFAVTGDVLAEIAVIRRFAEDGDSGVQRGQKTRHAQNIADAMREGVPFPENMVANLEGDWIVDEGALLANNKKRGTERLAGIEIIDGQHRVLALQMLIGSGEEEVARKYTFTIRATLDASDTVRAQLFSMQSKRMRVDRTHDLTLRARHDDFTSETERRCHTLAVALNTRADSPPQGKIFFGERAGQNNRSQIPKGMFPLRGIMSALRPIASDRRGPMTAFSMEEREQIVVDMLRASSDTFSNFLKADHVLGQTLGISALLAVLSKNGEFHLLTLEEASGDRREAYRQGNMAVVLRLGQHFQWKPRSDIKRKASASPYAIAQRFNEYLQRRNNA